MVHPLCGVFLRACEEIGIPLTRDFNGAEPEGAGLWQVTIKDGVRVSAANAYLRPAQQPRESRGQSCMRSRRACCLRAHARAASSTCKGGARHNAQARREVLLCGGSINSPQLLELSGIGDAQRLRTLGIPVLARLAGRR